MDEWTFSPETNIQCGHPLPNTSCITGKTRLVESYPKKKKKNVVHEVKHDHSSTRTEFNLMQGQPPLYSQLLLLKTAINGMCIVYIKFLPVPSNHGGLDTGWCYTILAPDVTEYIWLQEHLQSRQRNISLAIYTPSLPESLVSRLLYHSEGEKATDRLLSL